VWTLSGRQCHGSSVRSSWLLVRPDTIRCKKARVYAILFRAAAETLRTIAADPRHLGADIGLVAVLHSWGQNLLQNPHS
jgi:hypothetical protein